MISFGRLLIALSLGLTANHADACACCVSRSFSLGASDFRIYQEMLVGYSLKGHLYEAAGESDPVMNLKPATLPVVARFHPTARRVFFNVLPWANGRDQSSMVFEYAPKIQGIDTETRDFGGNRKGGIGSLFKINVLSGTLSFAGNARQLFGQQSTKATLVFRGQGSGCPEIGDVSSWLLDFSVEPKKGGSKAWMEAMGDVVAPPAQETPGGKSP